MVLSRSPLHTQLVMPCSLPPQLSYRTEGKWVCVLRHLYIEQHNMMPAACVDSLLVSCDKHIRSRPPDPVGQSSTLPIPAVTTCCSLDQESLRHHKSPAPVWHSHLLVRLCDLHGRHASSTAVHHASPAPTLVITNVPCTNSSLLKCDNSGPTSSSSSSKH